MFGRVKKMLQYERIDVSKRIGINISNKSKECITVIIGILKKLFLNLNHMFFKNDFKNS